LPLSRFGNPLEIGNGSDLRGRRDVILLTEGEFPMTGKEKNPKKKDPGVGHEGTPDFLKLPAASCGECSTREDGKALFVFARLTSL
jgi:hypothetical protein